MNRIVLIGNGFDLAHGLKTSYKDFIDDYWMNIGKEIIESRGIYEKNGIKSNVSFSSFSLSVLNKDLPFSYQKLIESLESIDKRSYKPDPVVSISIKLLQFISEENHLSNWVDIENVYYKFLLNFLLDNRLGTYYYSSIENLNSHFDYIKQELQEYLYKIQGNTTLQIDRRIHSIIYAPFNLKDCIKKAQKEITANEHSKIYSYFSRGKYLDFDTIEEKTIPFTVDIEKEFDSDDFDLMSYLLDEKISTKYFDLAPSNVLFLNFNYTNLETLYSKHETIQTEINHIHGELKNDHNPIIFGYGDELEESYQALENKQDNEFLKNIKSIQYLETDNYKRMLEFIESDHYQIIILGHSCGNSDRTLLNTLFEHKNCVSIKPYYYRYREKGSKDTKDNYSDIVRNISRNFKDKKSMRDKVVNKKYCDWFSEDIKE